MFKSLFALFIATSTIGLCGPNQTDDVSPLLSPNSLPYEISIVRSDFQLPSNNTVSSGLQSFVWGVYHGKWLLLSGRTNGLHGFNADNDNFTIKQQNTVVYVVDPKNKTVVSRNLLDPSSQLTQTQIDNLSVTAPQFYQSNNTLYVVGGYGVDTPTGQFSTKSTLTAIDIPGLMRWVENKSSKVSAAQYIRQTSHPLLQVTGGFMSQTDPHHPFLLVFGQNFTGFYSDSSSGVYTQQIRPFKIIDNGKKLSILPEKQNAQNPNYNRRDLNVIPIIQKNQKSYTPAFVALSGVFTSEDGIWTVPVVINADGSSFMPDPSNPNTFKQGMNSYECARAGLYSKKNNEMFILLFGGISYLFAENGVVGADIFDPFINNVSTVKIDSQGNFAQYLMPNEFPLIQADFAHIGATLYFGAEARFIRSENLPTFSNDVISLDDFGSSPVLLGYIVGGIQSTVTNTADPKTETAASPYIFSVFLQKK